MHRRSLLATPLLLPGLARAQPAWPARPVRVIVPFPPGQATDIMARLLSEQLGQRLGQPFVVDNRAGGAGLPGMELIAKAAPDGHTLGMASSGPLSINPAVMAKLPYDVERDFVPIALVFTTPLIAVVHPGAGIESLAALVARAKAAPGQLDYASGGPGSSLHLAAEAFCQQAGIRLNHIPYRGSAPAMTDLIAGNVKLMFDSLAAALPHIQGGRVKALGVTSAARMPQLPELPTVAEAAGLPGFEVLGWAGLIAPAGTPAPVVARLAAAVLEAVRGAPMAARIIDQGATPAPLGPEEFGGFIRSELIKLRAVAQAADVRLD
ncbi:tripartite tricarboxylate transporter substrate binding protein [Paeniroseomonas aquatica]|uniref:Tripartite tricarboxylate transporter substrate binding protein n=1 Tax=Paeniroseomonas aquatica TaxID=373043 RepID=A0ABT8AB93_9PROT|nr:tripartite tricarboxylate transporter substrate binding protein [Paeniroseomonas aquatica]MDN3566943.1 tripartite tricarboxylate transporter substrate binding protein [Paeniroseomonas aquatica]